MDPRRSAHPIDLGSHLETSCKGALYREAFYLKAYNRTLLYLEALLPSATTSMRSLFRAGLPRTDRFGRFHSRQ